MASQGWIKQIPIPIRGLRECPFPQVPIRTNASYGLASKHPCASVLALRRPSSNLKTRFSIWKYIVEQSFSLGGWQELYRCSRLTVSKGRPATLLFKIQRERGEKERDLCWNGGRIETSESTNRETHEAANLGIEKLKKSKYIRHIIYQTIGWQS